jgi:translocation and assembly module TamB
MVDETSRAAASPPPDGSGMPTAGAQGPAPTRRRAARTALAVFAALLVLVIATASFGLWAVRSERGSAWLLSHLPGVQVVGPRGALLGDFAAQKLTVNLPGGNDTVTLADLAWRGLQVERVTNGRWLRVALASLSAARVDLAIAPNASTAPIKAPADLQLPIELDVRELRIGELHAGALGTEPIRGLTARLHLGAADGAEHRVERLSLRWQQLQASGDARIATVAPMALAASLALVQQIAAVVPSSSASAAAPVGSRATALPPWRASATLTGPLAAPVFNATLRAEPSPTRPAQTLDARATLRPFAAWPLGELRANSRALDLSAFAAAAPSTALDLEAVASSTAADQPASVAIELSNALAGRWNEGRLPLRALTLALSARPDRTSTLTLRSFNAELGTAQAAAGQVKGDGYWSPERWSLALTLADLLPAQLDGRAPSMRLSGPVTLARSPNSPGSPAAIETRAKLAGSVTERGTARPVQLQLDAALSPQRLEIRTLQASAGDARATVKGVAAQPAADAPWAVKAQAALVEFDPAVWWPGAADSPWRRADHRLNAQAAVDLVVAAQAVSQPLPAALAALRGSATLTLAESRLAGVPLRGQASLRSEANAQMLTRLRLDADGNSLTAEGRFAASGSGNTDTWDVTADAPMLAKLSPLFKLLQAPGTDPTLAGALTAQAHVAGRWPALTTQGRLAANDLRAGPLAVQKADAQWRLGSAPDAAVDASATLTQASLAQGTAAGPSIDTLQLQLKGTGRAHTLEARADAKAKPPAWAEALQAGAATNAASRTVATLQAQGGLVAAEGSTAAGWRGTLQQLDLRSNAAGSAPLLHAQNLALDAVWAGTTPRASVQPGRVELLGGALRWSRLSWQAAGSAGGYAQIETDAEIEPLRVSPLLARAQPDFGWGGDLTVAGRITLRSAPTFSADVVIERRSGDLTVTDELGTRTLGLTDLRVGLIAADGTWSFFQGLAGTNLGVLAGAEVVRTSPQATWPPADAPLQGVLELRVDDLGSWGHWVPPGWRVGGALHTNASFGGRFGAPEYTGEVEGRKLSVRNFLQGVNVSEGDVAIHLQGTRARIERFTAKAGSGSLKLEGDASLGETPRALLKVTAEQFQLLGRVDRRIVTSGVGTLQLDAKTLAFDGQFGVDEGLIDFTRSDAPRLADDVTVVRAKDAPSPAAAASAAASPTAAPDIAGAPPREVRLDLRVTLGEKLRVRGRGLDAGLRGDLRITSPGGRLAVNGTVQAVNGTYAAYGQKLVIDRGLIAFSGSLDTPRLDIEATRPNIDQRVGVIISGTPANPRVRLFSEPELSEIDKLSWLVMGRASDGLGRTDTALLQRAALALLAGEGGSPTDQITKALGLDDLSLRQTDGAVRETVIALGKQLSKRWYVGYERGLNATTGSFQLVYRLAQRFTLRAQSGDDNSLDLIWVWRWQ